MSKHFNMLSMYYRIVIFRFHLEIAYTVPYFKFNLCTCPYSAIYM